MTFDRTGILRASDFGPDDDDRDEAVITTEELRRTAAQAFARYMAVKNSRGLVRCPACLGSGDGVEFATNCGACEGTGTVTPADAAEIRGAA